MPSPCPRLGYLNNGERSPRVQVRLKRRGDEVVAPPRTPALDYSTVGTVCQRRMHSGRQTSWQRWRPPVLGRCGFVLEGHIRRSKLNPDSTVGCHQRDLGDTSTTWSVVVANEVLADGAGSSFSG